MAMAMARTGGWILGEKGERGGEGGKLNIFRTSKEKRREGILSFHTRTYYYYMHAYILYCTYIHTFIRTYMIDVSICT